MGTLGIRYRGADPVTRIWYAARRTAGGSAELRMLVCCETAVEMMVDCEEELGWGD